MSADVLAAPSIIGYWYPASLFIYFFPNRPSGDIIQALKEVDKII